MDYNHQLLPPVSVFPYSSLLHSENDLYKTDCQLNEEFIKTAELENQQPLYPSGVSPIAPNAETTTNTPNTTTTTTTRKKPKRRRIITPEQRTAANVRERKRMFSMNDGFDELRKHLPKFSYENKLSRIETLRLAIIYIQYMTDIVKHNKSPSEATVRSLKHGWPSSKPRYHFPPFLPTHLYPGCTMIPTNDIEYFNQSMAVFPMEINQSPTGISTLPPGYPTGVSDYTLSQNSEPYW
ncbi:neurogenic differentiation factor 1-like [Convolutriloba macropyga]|uniref:neurogenic differentiation factor 1-like n=1 Tax=Convolutriloba macropyga TaxID=536237 RepID=UPI003F52585E